MQAPSIALVLILLVGIPTPAQQFSATATAQLLATVGWTAQSWGPGALSASPAAATANNMFGTASAGASLSGTALDIVLQAASSGFARADVSLLLAAPEGAGVRVRIQPTMPIGSGLVGMTASALGRTHQPGAGGDIEFDALVPVGGLTIQIWGGLNAPAYGADTFGFATTWSYPGVANVGAPTPGCRGDAVAWSAGVPRLGNTAFGLTCQNAHAFLGAVSAIGFGGLTTPVLYDGVDVWLDPSLPILSVYLPSDANGRIVHPLPLPSHASYIGLTLFSQFLLLEPTGCTPLGLSGSNAVRLTVQV